VLEPKDARSGSKKDIVLKLLQREAGATLAEIAKATDWQNHSIRGFLSAQVGKKMGLKVESTNIEGERTYRIVSYTSFSSAIKPPALAAFLVGFVFRGLAGAQQCRAVGRVPA
jgi:hypothetical protein